MMKTLHLLLLLLASMPATILAQSRPSAALLPASRGLSRWAILCPPGLPDPSLEPRLLAALNEVQQVQLLDREHLQRVIRELTLSEAMGPDQVPQRLQLGQLLPADAVLIVTAQPDKSLRLIIVDCRLGIRLHAQTFPSSAELLAGAPSLIQAMQQQFPGGVKRVIAVPPFVNRDLTHDHDAHQSEYAQLLASSLMTHPGVAVVEIEEARALAAESALGSRDSSTPLTPLILEGQFRTERTLSGASSPANAIASELLFHLTVKWTGANDQADVDSGPMTLAGSRQWLAADLTHRLLRQDVQAAPPIKQTVVALIQRADLMARAGAFEHSTTLREAALLLDDKLPKQRLLAAQEYLILARRPLGLPLSDIAPDNPAFRAAFGRNVQAYLSALTDLETLIRNQQITADDAINWSKRAETTGLRDSGTQMINEFGAWRRSSYEIVRRAARDLLGQAEDAKERFLLEVYPLVLSLPDAPATQSPDRYAFLLRWQQSLLSVLHRRSDRTFATKRDLDVFRCAVELLPDELIWSRLQLPTPVQPQVADGDDARQIDYDQLEQALIQSRSPIGAVAGRLACIERRFHANSHQAEVLRPLLVEARTFFHDCEQKPLPIDPAIARERQRFLDYADRLCQSIESAIERAPAQPVTPTAPAIPPAHLPQSQPLTTAPTASDPEPLPTTRPSASTTPSSPTEWTNGAVHFRRLPPFNVRLLNGQTTTLNDRQEFLEHLLHWRYLNVLSCGEKLDLHWNQAVLALMRQPGELEEIFFDETGPITTCVWDGLFIWVGTRNQGLWVLDAQGKIIRKITAEQGLPPADQALLLHPLSPGRVVAVGCLGAAEQTRNWCAIVEVSLTIGASVNIFHEAKDLPRPAASMPATSQWEEDNPHRVFIPRWIHAYQPKGATDRPILLIGRGMFQPLQVDLKTLNLSVFPLPHGLLGDKRPGMPVIRASRDGVMLIDGPRLLPPPGETWPDGQATRSIVLSGLAARSTIATRQLCDTHDGFFYLYGSSCWRLDTRTWSAERLTAAPILHPLNGALLVQSAHYGLVAIMQAPSSRLEGADYYQIDDDKDSRPLLPSRR